MNLKSLEAQVLVILGNVEGAAAGVPALLAQLPMFINLADTAASFVDDAAKALKGADKLALVQAMAAALANELGLGAQFATLWALIGPAVTILVQLRKLGFIKF